MSPKNTPDLLLFIVHIFDKIFNFNFIVVSYIIQWIDYNAVDENGEFEELAEKISL